LLVAFLQLLLAAGVLPVTMAWGGTQDDLTPGLRAAHVLAAAVMLVSSYLIRRRAGLETSGRPSTAIGIAAWTITLLLAINTVANVTSASSAEAIVFGPLSLLLALCCLLVSASEWGSQQVEQEEYRP
jgi:hypothetical protein